MRRLRLLALLVSFSTTVCAAPIHVWEKQELTFTAEKTHANPYLDVIVWVADIEPTAPTPTGA
jgi:hypothetical protein